MTRFCLVRHGQTDWNVQGRYQGQSDIPLNETGLEQARQTAQKLNGHPFAAIFSSDLQRAVQTAAAVARDTDLPVQIDTRLREINQGEWEGHPPHEIKERYPEIWKQRVVDPGGVRPPGGETVNEVAERVKAALDDIAQRYPEEDVLIASHGLALATVICMARSIPLSLAFQAIPQNAEPVWVTWKSNGNKK